MIKTNCNVGCPYNSVLRVLFAFQGTCFLLCNIAYNCLCGCWENCRENKGKKKLNLIKMMGFWFYAVFGSGI